MTIPDPIILLDSRSRYVHPAASMQRASPKHVWDNAGRLVQVPIDALGWDHDPLTGASRGYLAEISTSNLLRNSGDLTQSNYGMPGVVVLPDTGVYGPDGVEMDKVVAATSYGFHHIHQSFSVSANSSISFQCIAKSAGIDQIRLSLYDDDNTSEKASSVDFNLLDGTASAVSSSADPPDVYGIIPLGDGFYLCWLSTPFSVDNTGRARVWLWPTSGGQFEGDGVSGAYLGCWQAEIGALLSGYIPTGASPVTRSGDGLIISNLDSFPWWRQHHGTLVMDCTPPSVLRGAHRRLFHFAGPDGNVLYTTINPPGTVFCSSNYANLNINFYNIASEPYKRRCFAVGWDSQRVVGAMDGAIMGQQDISNPMTLDTLGIGVTAGRASPMHGHTHRVVYYPQRLSNADLQAISAVQEQE